jgi:hypothetical protein
MERLAFNSWIDDFARENQISAATTIWFHRRFYDELDRCRALEKRWRKIFWLSRYLILSGSLVLPVLITASKGVTWLNPVGIAVSIVVALASAVEALLRSGRKWRLYRQGADALSTEGAAFFQMMGLYNCPDPAERLRSFKERVESHMTELRQSYIADIDVMASQNVIGSSSERP